MSAKKSKNLHDDVRVQAIAQEMILGETLPLLFSSSNEPDFLAKEIVKKIDAKLRDIEKDGDQKSKIYAGVTRTVACSIIDRVLKDDRKARKK